jgi:hypothetical protein
MENMPVSWAAIAAGLGEHRPAGDGSRLLVGASVSAWFADFLHFCAARAEDDSCVIDGFCFAP